MSLLPINRCSMLLLFFLFIVPVTGAKELDILIITKAFDRPESADAAVAGYLENITGRLPFSCFNDMIKWYHYRSESECYRISDQGRFIFKVPEIYKVVDECGIVADCIIFIHEHDSNAASGGLIGKRKMPVVLVASTVDSDTLFHEICHALFRLGDEYGGDDPFPPPHYEIRPYKNLTTEIPVDAWEKIKRLTGNLDIGYYAGGAGRDSGVYHSYPNCLMRDTAFSLCPVCLSISLDVLYKITGRFVLITDICNRSTDTVPVDGSLQYEIIPVVR